MRERTIDVDGLDFSVIEAGAGQRPLLLVHGYTGAKEDFAHHLDALAERGWWAVAVDHRGHGGSPKPADENAYSLVTLADDVHGWVDALGWDRYVLLGHSMGGMVAQIVAIADPDRLDGLILMDTTDEAVTVDADLALAAATIAREQGMTALKEVMDSIEGPLDTPAYQRTLAERPGYQEFCDDKFLSCSPAMYAAMMAEMIGDVPPRTAALAELAVPALVIVGEQDEPFLGSSKRMAELLDADLVVIPDGGHSPQFEAPDAWLAALTGFLARLR